MNRCEPRGERPAPRPSHSPAAQRPSARVAYLYRVRSQIEWIFRPAKSVLRLDQTESQNPARIPCESSARWLWAVWLLLWQAHANAQCWFQQAAEIRFEKLIRGMQPWGHTLARAFFHGPEKRRRERRTLWRHLLFNAR